MGEEIAISLTNVSKCFKRYNRPVDRLKEILLPGKNRSDEFWALQDINIDISRGETLGIIGQNGSGKSTLLQIIAGTLTPTHGDIQVNGRISALLELGSGFNPEFTGRQNVFFNGRILGLTQEEIENKFDEIAAFADIGDFIEQPVRTYSSGMMVRLAFAVAVNVNPNILIVDEALAVGDIYFQARCFKRMRTLIDSGITVLFVSHDLGMVKALCERCLWLEHGKTVAVGSPRKLAEEYQLKGWEQQGLFAGHSTSNNQVQTPEITSENQQDINEFTHLLENSTFTERVANERSGTGDIRILDFQLCDKSGNPKQNFDYDEVVIAKYIIKANINMPVYEFGMIVKDLKGNEVFSVLDLPQNGYPFLEKNQIAEATFKTMFNLRSGGYYVTIAVMGYENHERYIGDIINLNGTIFYDYIEMAYFFDVNYFKTRPVHGPVHFDIAVQVDILRDTKKQY